MSKAVLVYTNQMPKAQLAASLKFDVQIEVRPIFSGICWNVYFDN